MLGESSPLDSKTWSTGGEERQQVFVTKYAKVIKVKVQGCLAHKKTPTLLGFP